MSGSSQHLKVRLTKAIAIWQIIFHLLKVTYAAKKEMSKEAAPRSIIWSD